MFVRRIFSVCHTHATGPDLRPRRVSPALKRTLDAGQPASYGVVFQVTTSHAMYGQNNDGKSRSRLDVARTGPRLSKTWPDFCRSISTSAGGRDYL